MLQKSIRKPAVFFCLGLLLASALAPRVFAGGGWVSGGEDGVACFASNEARDLYTDDTGELTGNAVNHIVTVETLDLYERSVGGPESIPRTGVWPIFLNDLSSKRRAKVPNKETLSQQSRAVQNSIENLKVYTASWRFYELLREIGSKHPFERWKFIETRLSKIDDAGAVGKIKENCTLVQLANRKQRLRNGQLEMEVTVDWVLWDMMEPIQKVALVLHEGVYTLTRLLDHGDSSRTRTFVALLLSEEFEEQRRAGQRKGDFTNAREWFYLQLNQYGLQDYRSLVLDIKADTDYSARTRSLELLKRKLQIARIAASGEAISDQLLRLRHLRTSLSEYEAFLYFLAVWKLEEVESPMGSLGQIDFLNQGDTFVRRETVERFTETGKDTMLISYANECVGISNYYFQSVGFENPAEYSDKLKRENWFILEKALSFCDAYQR